MPTILHKWKRAGVTKEQVQSWYVAGKLMEGNVGPQMQSVLERYGLESLARWASDAIVYGKSQEQIMLELRDRPEFVERFPAIQAREKAGLSPISPEDYLQYEKAAEALGSQWGLELSKSEVDNLLTNDVSARELEERFNISSSAVYESSPETRDTLRRFFEAGVSQGDLMRYWMDPKKEFGRLQQEFRMGQIGGAAMRVGYGNISKAQSEQLMGAGLDEQAAVEGFSTLTRMRDLFKPINRAEPVISEEDQIDFLAGDVEAARAVERRVQERAARFTGQGGFSPGEQGFTTGTAP